MQTDISTHSERSNPEAFGRENAKLVTTSFFEELTSPPIAEEHTIGVSAEEGVGPFGRF